MFDEVLNLRKKAQKNKVHRIEVKEAVRTPSGDTILVPIKKSKSLQAMGLVMEIK